MDEIKNMFKIIHEHDGRQPDSFKKALEEAKKNIMAAALEDVPSKINENGKEEKREAKKHETYFHNQPAPSLLPDTS